MTAAEIDAALAAYGIHLDPVGESIIDGQRRLNYSEVLALLPGATADELASWATLEAWLPSAKLASQCRPAFVRPSVAPRSDRRQ